MVRACLLAVAAAVAVAAASGEAVAQSPKPESPGGAVALLPLDAGARLEIYGQAVATEIARALMAGGVEVVVVGANMDVPASARLIVDGRVATEKAGVALSVRVRNPADGWQETLSATAPSLAQIDKAAADLSARVLPVVRERLAALPPERPGGGGPVRQLPPGGAVAGRQLLVGIWAGAGGEALRGALAGALEPWARAARRELRVVDPRSFAGDLTPKAVASSNVERAIAFEVLGYSVQTARNVPLARARVRVRISDAATVLFDRVVATETIVGDRGMPLPELAARVAEEVLAILRPHVRRATPPWP